MSKHKMLIVCMTMALLFGLAVAGKPASAEKPTVNVVSLGDSYTSGNAAGSYYGPSSCYRSGKNYSEQYVAHLRSVASVTYTNLACSGATTANMEGQINENPAAVKNADLILMSIGGNDADFAGIAINCFHGHVVNTMPCIERVEATWAKIPGIVTKVMSALTYVQSRAPHARIILVGYPYLLGDCNFTIPIQNSVTGAVSRYGLGDQLRMLQNNFEGKLTAQLGLSVYGLNLRYVSLQRLYAGHEQCASGTQWIASMYSSLSHMEYLHPNALGHEATGDELYRQNIHSGLLGGGGSGSGSGTGSGGQPAGGAYVNLPFLCGTVIPHVSTYDSFMGFQHGRALDMPIGSGTPVITPVAGTVSVLYDAGGYGRYVDVLDPSGITHRFAHMQMTVSVVTGQRVQRGEQIGKVGVTGATTGPHLHYEWRLNGEKIKINLGAVLNWGPNQDSSGFRTTTHSLKSGNCGGAATPATKQDLLIWERTALRYARSNGRAYSNWEPFVSGISNPAITDSCEFDGDRFTEYVSFEENFEHFAIGNPKKDAGFEWSIISTGHPHVDNFACIDWNQDGKEDIWMRNTAGKIYLGISDGKRIIEWRVLVLGIGPLSHLDACDLNGDGQDEIVAYEPGFFQIMVAERVSNSVMHWRRLLKGIGPISGLACGDFVNSHRGDEVIVWQPEQNGRYVMGEFSKSFDLLAWEPLNPTGLGKPFRNEISAGDIDADGLDELIVNELRIARGNHSIMVGNFTSARKFEWYPFIERIDAQNVEVGDFVD